MYLLLYFIFKDGFICRYCRYDEYLIVQFSTVPDDIPCMNMAKIPFRDRLTRIFNFVVL